jgi:hypothetical protein
MFPQRLAKGYSDPAFSVVEEVNGIRVRNLRHLVETLRDAKERYVVLRFAERGAEHLVFEREKIEATTEEILNDNGIRDRCSPDLREVWGAR